MKDYYHDYSIKPILNNLSTSFKVNLRFQALWYVCMICSAHGNVYYTLDPTADGSPRERAIHELC